MDRRKDNIIKMIKQSSTRRVRMTGLEMRPMTQQRPQFHTFGQYLLLDRLACGGMAEIYLGRPLALRGDGRIVVVKRVLPQVADDPNFINMFRTETRVCVG